MQIIIINSSCSNEPPAFHLLSLETLNPFLFSLTRQPLVLHLAKELNDIYVAFPLGTVQLLLCPLNEVWTLLWVFSSSWEWRFLYSYERYLFCCLLTVVIMGWYKCYRLGQEPVPSATRASMLETSLSMRSFLTSFNRKLPWLKSPRWSNIFLVSSMYQLGL